MIKIGIVGGGNMGAAIIGSAYREFDIVLAEKDRQRSALLRRKFKVQVSDFKELVRCSSVIILAVKPQDMADVLSEIKGLSIKSKLFISIAAGITTRFIEERLVPGAKVIRTMPNMPAQIGEGFTAVCKGKNIKSPDIVMACNIFECVGKTAVVDEKLLDAITAVSGSGPAYLFLFVECFIKAAHSLGIDLSLSHKLVMNTLLGSIHMLDIKREDPSVLRARVTSKGGTTQAALEVFNKGKFERIFANALKAAKKRAKQLSY